VADDERVDGRLVPDGAQHPLCLVEETQRSRSASAGSSTTSSGVNSTEASWEPPTPPVTFVVS
jgi:hypothetical protein